MTDGPNPIVRAPLSDAGRERRDQMLLELQGVMRRRVRVRRAVRVAGAGGAVCTLAVAAIMMWAGTRSPQQTPLAHTGPANVRTTPVAPVPPAENMVQAPMPAYELVRTDASSLEKYVVSGGGGTRVEVLSDEGLLQALAKTGNVYGFVRTGDHVSVTCYSCDDGADGVGSPRSPAGGAGRPPEPPRGDV
jgi:hypothetical protein